MENMYSFFKNITVEAGKIALEGFYKKFKVDFKGDVDPVTEYDKKTEEFLKAKISSKFSNVGFFAEEDEKRSLEKEYTVFIDPIDGTVNYSHGFPIWCVSVGVYKKGVAEFSFVYVPVLNELFEAYRGKGAKLNGRYIRVSNTTDLKRSVVATGFPYDKHKSDKNNIDNFSKVIRKVQGIRRAGAAAVDICYVACGRFDGFWELKLKPWDTAAGVLIATEAGAKVSDLKSGEWEVFGDEILLTNGKIHDKMVDILKG